MDKLNQLIDSFIKQSEIYCETIPEGNYKKGNTANKQMMKLYAEIKKLNGENLLKKYLNDDNEGTRFCIASVMIKEYPEESLKVLEEAIKKKNLYGMLAMGIVDLWKKKKL